MLNRVNLLHIVVKASGVREMGESKGINTPPITPFFSSKVIHVFIVYFMYLC